MRAWAGAVGSIWVLASGCANVSVRNPDFDVSREQAREDWKRMESEPMLVDRPIVVLAGWRQMWPTPISDLSAPIQRLTGASPEDVLTISYPLAGSIEPLDELVVRRVEERWPSDSGEETVEVDVVGMSMGGLVARRAAIAQEGRKRLKIRRLFTIATPHRGAAMASYVFIDAASYSMRPGSDYLAVLDEALSSADYEMYCYARLNDLTVGATNTAPEGEEPFWVSGSHLLSHIGSGSDPRIIADIARRLRGESALAVKGTAPPRD
jgi:hypothetical protein